MKTAALVLVAVVALAGPVQAGTMVEVTVTGEVEFNFIGDPPLSGVLPGDAASLTFLVDSDIFVDGAGNTRGYEIDQSSFSLAFGSDVTVGLADPFPPGETPYFTLADGIPVSDRFWVSTSVNSPGGVPLEQDPINANVDIGYTGDTLGSLDILDALGTYDFDGLTSFGFNLWSIFPDNVGLGMIFEQMTIATEAEPVLVEVAVTGQVIFNGIGDPPLGSVQSGDMATMTFLVDANNFTDGMALNTRGYEIIQSSFSLTFASDVTVGLADPFPPGETPYFTLADGIPVSDRFWVSTSINSPGGVPLEQDPINANVDLGYTGDTLGSLDILDALGTYDFGGLTSFGFNLWAIFPDNVAMEMDFAQMTISAEGQAVPVAFDIKPGSCPNSFNVGSHGVLPAAILGTDEFDITQIDVTTIALSRADGVGGSVAAARTEIEDVGTPFDGEPCECHEMGFDGYDDLTMKFLTQDVVAALDLNTSQPFEMIELVVTGTLLDGTAFVGADCIRIVPGGLNQGPTLMITR